MTSTLSNRPGGRRSHAPVAAAEHHAIRTISRTLTVSIVVLLIASAVMVTTGLMVRQFYEQETAHAEQVRAANAVDYLVGQIGPMTPAHAELIGRIAGLKEAQLSAVSPSGAGVRSIPLVGKQSVSGGYLAWKEGPFVSEMFRVFAPVRMPTILAMLLVVAALIFYVRRQVGDIEAQRRLAYQQSRTDVVTGLANRLAFETAMASLAARNAAFGVIACDLDRFKAVNDALGHAAGDVVLRTVGHRLHDLLAPGDMLARLGGDEFVILTVNCSDSQALARLAQDCIATIGQPIALGEQVVQVGASLGVAAADRGSALPPEALLRAADSALYRAKARRGSCYEFVGEAAAPRAPMQLQSAWTLPGSTSNLAESSASPSAGSRLSCPA